GRRITSDRALEVTTMVLNGSTNTRLLAAGRALGLRTVGISGVDSGLIQARRRPPVVARDGSTVDYGHVGDIDRVDPWLAERLLEDGAIPVVSPISADAAGALLNINADSVASALAIALKAVKLILVTEAAGLLDHPELPGSLISYTDLAGLARLKANGSVTAGMLPKLTAIERALEEGVPRAHIVSSQVPDSLLIEVFTNEGSGTLIVPELATLSSAEQAAP
ncbi:MAG TPA: acetylglutamate kinase, partial [Thermoanaerobaculia bacterium]|nr:acetylglutamate kinase [Thermoanaerobaculia bacterium]